TACSPRGSTRSPRGRARSSATSSASACSASPKDDHGTRPPATQPDHARGQALLGRPPGGKAPPAPLPVVRPRLLLPARPLPALPRADITWTQASGTGTLHAFEIAHQVFNKAWRVKPPYVLAMVELAEGPRLMSN